MHFAYDYGFRRVWFGTRDDLLPTDPDHDWLDHNLAVMAEAYWSRKLNMRRPDIGGSRPRPTPEDIAHVERCVKQMIASLTRWDRRNKQAFAG